MNTAHALTQGIFLALLMGSIFGVPVYALERPLFLDEVEEKGDISFLSASQKEELRLYLAQKSLEEADAHISITSLGVTLDTESYTQGQNAQLTVSWDSPMVPDVLQYAEAVPELSLNAYLTDAASSVRCSEKTVISFPITDKRPILSLPVTADCPDPEVSVTIYAPDGYALGFWTIYEPGLSEGERNTSSDIVVALVLLIGIVAMVVTRKSSCRSTLV